MDDTSDTSSALVQSFLAFTRVVITRWRTELEATPDEPEDRRIISQQFLPPRHMLVLEDLREDVARLEQTKHMVGAHAAAGRYFFPPEWAGTVAVEGSIAWNRLLETLTEALAAVIQYHGLDPSDSDAAAIYIRFMDAWTSKQIRYYIFSPMFNLRTSDYTKQFSIGDNYTIRLLNREDTALFPETRNEQILPILMWTEPWLVIVCDDFVANASKVSVEAFMDDVRIVIWAMRLVTAGYVSAPYIFAHALGPSVDVGHHFVTLNIHQDLEARRVPYVDLEERRKKVTYMLDDDTVVRIKDVYGQLKRLGEAGSNYGGLGFALRRFNLAFSRNAEDDRLIDLVTALDSVLGSGSQNELKYRISLRAAALLAEEGYDPALVQRHMQVIYDIRSSVVHTGKRIQDCDKDLRKLKMGSANDVTDKCIEYSRVVMRRYVASVHQYLTHPDDRPKTEKTMTNAELFSETIDGRILAALNVNKQGKAAEPAP